MRLLSILLLLLPAITSASFLWKIDTVPPSYIFGILHVPTPLIWDTLPIPMAEAFDRSDNIFLELDLTDMTMDKEFANCMPKNYKTVWEEKGHVPIIDIVLAWKARGLGKRLGSLESPKEKCDLSEEMKKMIEQFKGAAKLGHVKIDIPEINTEMEHYRKGKAEDGLPIIKAQMVSSAEVKKKAEDANLEFKKLLERRSGLVAERIVWVLLGEEGLRKVEGESNFFIVGVEHLADLGKYHANLVDKLRTVGFKVEPVPLEVGGGRPQKGKSEL